MEAMFALSVFISVLLLEAPTLETDVIRKLNSTFLFLNIP